ncbi:MAG: sigma-54-dependent Fis family transcriptional regulator [Myxococcales bacterium]|nr:sigma-54-dependent Fis family transcriptional regulator [Myxococcales bacterium]
MSTKQEKAAVLVVEDDAVFLKIIEGALEALECGVIAATTRQEAISRVNEGHHGVILLDVELPDGSGLDMIQELKQIQPNNPIILMTGDHAGERAISATLAGAFDFITKDQQFNNRVFISTRNALDSMQKEDRIQSLTHTSTGRRGASPIISRSAEMAVVLADIDKLGTSKVSVLIQGASGTGKEVVAHAIHDAGPRRTSPFIAVNCAGIPDSLLESELLGYERGAFTGAVARKIGRFEAAHGGTIFLDEIGEMSLPLQAKLLRVVQDGRYERLGGNQTIEVDVRVLSATNRDLTQMVEDGTFREDLYYRLAVFTLNLPSLAKRKDDVEPLVRHFLRNACRDEDKTEPQISSEVMHMLKQHPWPGNVRQLQNVIRHAVVVGDGEWMTIGDLPSSFTRGLSELQQHRSQPDMAFLPALQTSTPMPSRLDTALSYAFPDSQILPSTDDLEAAAIRLVMKRLDGNRKRSAEVLGISRATLYRRLDATTAKAN